MITPYYQLFLGFNAKKNVEKIFQNFGPGSAYNNALTKMYRKNMADKSMYPIQGKWQGFLLRRFATCHSEGKTLEETKEEDTNVDPDNIIRNIPLIAMLAGKPELMDTLYKSILQVQINDMIVVVVMAVSRLIERYILNGSLEGGADDSLHPVERVIRDLKDPGRVCADQLDLAMAGHLNKVLENRAVSVEDASRNFGVSWGDSLIRDIKLMVDG